MLAVDQVSLDLDILTHIRRGAHTVPSLWIRLDQPKRVAPRGRRVSTPMVEGAVSRLVDAGLVRRDGERVAAVG